MALSLVRKATAATMRPESPAIRARQLTWSHSTMRSALLCTRQLRRTDMGKRRYGSAQFEKAEAAVTRSSASTATAKTAASPDRLQARNGSAKHVILPNPVLDSFMLTRRVLPSNIAEQFAVLHACIRTGSMERAERIMQELYKSKPEEMKVFCDIHIYNAFLNGFAEAPTPMRKQCLFWYDAMRVHHLTPDAGTYAIVVKLFLKVNSYHTARAILEEMQKEGNVTIHDMMQSGFLSGSDMSMFRKLIRESKPNASTEVQALLQELQTATDDILGKEEPLVSETMSSRREDSELPMEPIPEARPTKAMGVKFLQEQLMTLRDPNKAMQMDPYELQMELERQGYEVALQRLLHMKEAMRERGDTLTAMNLTPLKKVMWEWHEKIVPKIEQEIRACENAVARDTERRIYGPFLKLLPPQKLSMITMLELLRLHNSSGINDGMKTARAVIDIGKAVEMEYNATLMKKSARHQEIHGLFSSGKLFNIAVRKAQSKLTRKLDAALTTGDGSDGDVGGAVGTKDWSPVWPSSIRAKVGSVLASIFIDSATIPVPSRNPETNEKIIEDIPAFFHTYQYVRGKRVGIIKFSDPLTSMLSREPVRDTLHPRLLPMIVHPKPWLAYNSGGYLTAKSTCMRIKDSPEQFVYLQKASEEDRLNAVLAGLDVLGSTCWRVNRNVFNVVLEAWNTGKAIADIPPAIDEPSPLPPKPENYDTDPKAKFNWVLRVKEIQTTDKNNHSLRCDVNYKVETARAFLNLPMYFPHNMDFRGRAYPIPPTLNHLGNDLCRGLLHFDEAKPLGERGWRWLKIHLANLYGFDKHSFTERENFTMENIDNILDSVDHPLTGKKWWLNAEAPWQCLAACYEVAAAYRSNDPTNFLSQIPIHQDGTCNGLQHYAALGGDLAGARAVNLAPGDRPADVYTGVAEMVNLLVDKEAQEGVEEARLLQGKISRKVVKQTVMTNVYGVTFIGARAQIESRLRERGDIPPEKIYSLAGYLARKVFSSLGEMFNGARLIQDWLTDSARRIAKSIPEEALQEAGLLPGPDGTITKGTTTTTTKKSSARKRAKPFSARNPSSNQMTSVIWTTPLGLPIVQPYRRAGKKQVATLLQTVFIEDPDASRPVNSVKQSTAFPPNFIHSLDATHMLMSAVACHKLGLTFASVHDSYWTHACDVDRMNTVIRDQFIELHSQPIMENLLKEFQERYRNYKIPMVREVEQKTKSKKKAAASKAAETPADTASVEEPPSPVFDNLKESRSELKSEKDAMEALFSLSATIPEAREMDDIDGNDDIDLGPKRKTIRKQYHSWEDLTFAPLPKKGEFDIKEVRESDYFFH